MSWLHLEKSIPGNEVAATGFVEGTTIHQTQPAISRTKRAIQSPS